MAITRPFDITVAICTYKRPQMLRDTLDTLQSEIVPSHVRWEILIIDNDPSCSAKRVLDDTASALPVRYISETHQGLSHARNRAVREAAGTIVAFLDDDVLVPQQWLTEMLRTFDTTGADCIGGRVLVKWDDVPDDAVRACEREIVAFDKGDSDYRFTGRNVPIGANLAVKTSVLRRYGPFCASLGRNRDALMGGEEVELLFRVMKDGLRVWYSASAYVVHRIGNDRVREEYYIVREYWNGRSLAVIDCLQNSPLYCHAKAWLRLAQLGLVVGPRSLWARATHNRRSRFLNACIGERYLGYWSTIVGFPSRAVDGGERSASAQSKQISVDDYHDALCRVEEHRM